jgi:hypothetical protein
MTRRGKSSGSGNARLDLFQKGDLPSSGERIAFVRPRSPTRAITRERPRLLGNQGLPRPGAKGVVITLAGGTPAAS